MAENSKIQWTHNTFNMWRGCQRVSRGCRLCYAERQAGRNPAVLGRWGSRESGGSRVVAAEAQWREPARWNNECAACHTRERVFCASIADVFEDWTGPMVNSQGEPLRAQSWYPTLGVGGHDPLNMSHVRVRLGDVIRRTPHLDWLLLTKRVENVLPMMADHMFGVLGGGRIAIPPNVWIGGTVEDQPAAERRGPELVRIRQAGVRVVFMSCEPLLEGVKVGEYLHPTDGVNWVICGGESGARADVTAFDPFWGRMLRDQCDEAGVPFFMKQLGSAPVQLTVKGKGGEMGEFPDYLRVREFPSVA
jgi:protein gp37